MAAIVIATGEIAPDVPHSKRTNSVGNADANSTTTRLSAAQFPALHTSLVCRAVLPHGGPRQACRRTASAGLGKRG